MENTETQYITVNGIEHGNINNLDMSVIQYLDVLGFFDDGEDYEPELLTID